MLSWALPVALWTLPLTDVLMGIFVVLTPSEGTPPAVA